MAKFFNSPACWRTLAALLLVCVASCRDSAVKGPGRTKATHGERTSSVVETAVADGPVAKAVDPSDLFFGSGLVPEIRIELKKSQEAKLREDLRRYVKCTIVERLPNPDQPDSPRETTYTEVAIKVKGAAGSSRELDDKPAFTLNMNKHAKDQTFHGLDKLHLNNSVQDESYLCEWVCAEIARDAKVPATRVSHARVWLNGRDLGFYVLKEGFDRQFLTRHFGDATGNFYDGGFVQDIDVDLEKDSGKGPDDHSDLHALKTACEEPDAAARWPAIEQQLDVDAFLTFMAFERMTCHWDGYTPNKNNYRIYFDPKDGRARFLPHGMDQMFSDPGFPLLEFPPTIVSSAVMHNPEWRQRYKDRVTELLPLFEAPETEPPAAPTPVAADDPPTPPSAPTASDTEPATLSPPTPESAPPADPDPTGGVTGTDGAAGAGTRTARAQRYGLSVQFEARPGDPELARLIENTVWINTDPPAYQRAESTRSTGYHMAVAVALALAPLATGERGVQQFVTAFLAQWGEAVRVETKGRGRGRAT